MSKLKGPQHFTIRRWTYSVQLTKDGITKEFQPPVMTIGQRPMALKAAEDIRQEFLAIEQFSKSDIKVMPDKHEKVDISVMKQVQGLNDEVQIVGLALKKACMQPDQSEDDLAIAIGNYIDAARNEIKQERASGHELVELNESAPINEDSAEIDAALAD